MYDKKVIMLGCMWLSLVAILGMFMYFDSSHRELTIDCVGGDTGVLHNEYGRRALDTTGAVSCTLSIK